MNILSLIVALYSLLSTVENRSGLTIQFDNVQHSSGQILVGLYEDEVSWRLRKPAKEFIVDKKNLVSGKLLYYIGDLPSGNYGIAVLDDENGNEIVDMGILFPKEGFGFSNYYHSSFIPPKFRNFEFSFPKCNLVKVRFRYLN